MTALIESYDIVDKWLYTVFSSDATLAGIVGSRIGADLIQPVTTTPYLTWSSMNTRAVYGVGGTILDTNSLFAIKVVGQGSSFNVCAPAARRVKELIHGTNTTLTTPVSSSLSCHWEDEIKLPEVSEGVQYRHLGGIYRILAVAL